LHPGLRHMKRHGMVAGLFAAAHEGGEIHQSLPDYRAPI
jgi:hypothetical protein